jgi:hypothetical protein
MTNDHKGEKEMKTWIPFIIISLLCMNTLFAEVDEIDNTPPTATNMNQNIAYIQGTLVVDILDIVVTDPDIEEIIYVVMILLELGDKGDLTANSGNGEFYLAGVWSITGTVAQVNAALADVAYVPVPGNKDDDGIAVLVMDQWEAGPAPGVINFNCVAPPNSPPTITHIPNQVTAEDTPTPPIPFTVDDAETSPYNLGVIGSSQNKTLIPDENIEFKGDGPKKTVTITPAPDAFGSTLVTVRVSDAQGDYTEETFWIEVTPVNEPPVIGDLPNQVTDEDIPFQFDFNTNDVDNQPDLLTFQGYCTNPYLVSSDNITFSGLELPKSGSATNASDVTKTTATIRSLIDRNPQMREKLVPLLPESLKKNLLDGETMMTTVVTQANITPNADAFGEADIIITVSDGEYADSDTFRLTVNPVNDAPQFLIPLPPITLSQGQEYTLPKALLYPIVEDVDDPDSTLTWTAAGNEHVEGGVTGDMVWCRACSDWTGTDTLIITVSDGELSASTPLIVTIVTSVSERPSGMIPTEFELYQNHPNPFNPVTTIGFDLPNSSHVILTVFNNRGQVIRTLVDGILNTGYHSIRWDASLVPSGIYVYQIRADGFTMVRKCMLMK